MLHCVRFQNTRAHVHKPLASVKQQFITHFDVIDGVIDGQQHAGRTCGIITMHKNGAGNAPYAAVDIVKQGQKGGGARGNDDYGKKRGNKIRAKKKKKYCICT